jgi:hypothetical protein
VDVTDAPISTAAAARTCAGTLRSRRPRCSARDRRLSDRYAFLGSLHAVDNANPAAVNKWMGFANYTRAR